jgi:hypothetical protein
MVMAEVPVLREVPVVGAERLLALDASIFARTRAQIEGHTREYLGWGVFVLMNR